MRSRTVVRQRRLFGPDRCRDAANRTAGSICCAPRARRIERTPAHGPRTACCATATTHVGRRNLLRHAVDEIKSSRLRRAQPVGVTAGIVERRFSVACSRCTPRATPVHLIDASAQQ
jgi:hypothetical protein